MVPEGSQITGQYSFLGVTLSIVIAVLGSYVALDLADQVAASRDSVRRAWWMGTLAMGIAIWSMHYTGMLAFHLPIAVGYHVPTTLLAFCIALVGSAIGLLVVFPEPFTWSKTTIAALFNGLGIVGLHLTSMASTRAAAVHRYDPFFLFLSAMIAVAGSLLSFWLTFGLRERTWSFTWKKFASALAMGMAAISGMHYMAMAGTKFFSAAPHRSFLYTVDISPLGVVGVVVVTVMVLAFMLFSAVMLQRVERAADSLILLDAIPQQIWSGPPDGTLDYCNERWRSYMGLGLEELQGEGWQRMLHPDDRERVLTAWRTAVTDGTPYEQEERHRRVDGTYRWFLARGIPFRDAAGRIIRWYGTNTDIEARKRAEEELRRLSSQLLRLQDEERRKIARNLHDSTAHHLVLLTASLQQLRTLNPALSSKALQLVSEAEDFAAQALREVRTLSYLLYPPMLDESGLEDAISHYVEGYSKRSGVNVDVQVSSNLGRLGRDTEMALFRVVQESLTNVQLHSGSHRAWIRLDRMQDSVILEIKDEGDTGRNPETRRNVIPGVGILSMRERVTQMAGHLEIESTAAGTTIRATIPANDKR